MEPVRIKLYGLVWMTKRSYVTQLVAAGLLLAGLLFIWVALPPLPSPAPPSPRGDGEELPASAKWGWLLLSNIPWVVLLLAALFALEAFIVLRRFAREEEKQRAQTGKK